MSEFKKWTKEEVEKFCEDNFIEEVEWLQNFVINAGEVSLDMDDSENPECDLIVKVKGVKE